jgi:hypothetical protein
MGEMFIAALRNGMSWADRFGDKSLDLREAKGTI